MRDAGATVNGPLIATGSRARVGAPAAATLRADVATTAKDATPSASPAAEATLNTLWTRAIVIFALAFAGLLALNEDTVVELWAVWGHNGTFTHGYFIYPVGLWLVWRLRHRLATIVPRAQPLALLPLLAFGAVWLVAHTAAVRAPEQYALIAMTQCLVWAVFGNAVTRRILYPLAFLYFAVPFGDFLMPTLMEHTADFTVQALRLSGVPVYREGNYFQIPSGNWSVVEACSGLRYLIASVTLGFLFAYLNYRSIVRRIAFIAASLLVPIVANWLRAYLIVMIAHLSSNALATGVDHIVYGWLFFGLVMLLLFSVGNLWRDDDVNDMAAGGAPAPVLSKSEGTRHARAIALIAALFVIVAAPWPALGNFIDGRADESKAEPFRIAQVDGWTADAPAFTTFLPHYVRSRSSYVGTFTSGERQVGLFVAYFSGQREHGQMLTYDNEVVRVADPDWGSVGQRTLTVPAAGDLTVLENDIKSDGSAGPQRLVTWRWFWINGRLTTSPALAKAYTALEKLLGHGDDSAVIVLTTPAGRGNANGSDSEATLQAFAKAAQPRILATLQAVRDEAHR